MYSRPPSRYYFTNTSPFSFVPLQSSAQDSHLLRGGVGYGSDGGVVGSSTSLGHGDGYGCEPEVPRGIQCDEEDNATTNAINHRNSSSSSSSIEGGSSSSSTSPPRISRQSRTDGVSPPDSPKRHNLHRTTDPAAAAIGGYPSEHKNDYGNSSSSQAECGSSVRVVFTQRRVRRSDGGGVETFRTESFGTPIIAVLPPVTPTHTPSLKSNFAPS